MRNFSDRLNWLIDQAGQGGKRMTLERFGQPIQYTKGQLSKMLSGEAKPETVQPRFWESIERVYGPDVRQWLQTGGEIEPVVQETGETFSEPAPGYGRAVSTKRLCREHLDKFLETCEGDPARLGWTLVELRERFPLTKFSSSVVTRAAVELLEAAGGEVLPERPEPLRKREADERNDPKHSRPGGAVKS